MWKRSFFSKHKSPNSAAKHEALVEAVDKWMLKTQLAPSRSDSSQFGHCEYIYLDAFSGSGGYTNKLNYGTVTSSSTSDSIAKRKDNDHNHKKCVCEGIDGTLAVADIVMDHHVNSGTESDSNDDVDFVTGFDLFGGDNCFENSTTVTGQSSSDHESDYKEPEDNHADVKVSNNSSPQVECDTVTDTKVKLSLSDFLDPAVVPEDCLGSPLLVLRRILSRLSLSDSENKPNWHYDCNSDTGSATSTFHLFFLEKDEQNYQELLQRFKELAFLESMGESESDALKFKFLDNLDCDRCFLSFGTSTLEDSEDNLEDQVQKDSECNGYSSINREDRADLALGEEDLNARPNSDANYSEANYPQESNKTLNRLNQNCKILIRILNVEFEKFVEVAESGFSSITLHESLRHSVEGLGDSELKSQTPPSQTHHPRCLTFLDPYGYKGLGVKSILKWAKLSSILSAKFTFSNSKYINGVSQKLEDISVSDHDLSLTPRTKYDYRISHDFVFYFASHKFSEISNRRASMENMNHLTPKVMSKVKHFYGISESEPSDKDLKPNLNQNSNFESIFFDVTEKAESDHYYVELFLDQVAKACGEPCGEVPLQPEVRESQLHLDRSNVSVQAMRDGKSHIVRFALI